MTAKGRFLPVALMMSDRLLLGVKQTVSAYILVLDDSLQRAKTGQSTFHKLLSETNFSIAEK